MKRVLLALREAGVRFSRDGCGFLAQALAFNSLFALFPLAALLLSAASLFPLFQGFAQDRVLRLVDELAPALHDAIANNLQSYIYGRGVSSIVALAIVVWSGKNLFLGLTYALNRALGVPKGRPLVHDIALSIVMLPVMGIMLAIALALPIVLSIVILFAHVPDAFRIARFGAYAISLALVFVSTATLYTFLPSRKLVWHFGIPGATLCAIVWPIVQYAFSVYIARTNFTHVYGALSAPLVLLLWFYFVSSIFLYGGQYCAAWAGMHGTEQVPTLVDQLEPVREA